MKDPRLEVIVKLDAWARQQGVSYNVWFSEAEDSYEIEIISAAHSEQYYQKRVHDFDQFLEAWTRNFKALKNK